MVADDEKSNHHGFEFEKAPSSEDRDEDAFGEEGGQGSLSLRSNDDELPDVGVLITAMTKHLQTHGAQLKMFRCSPFQDELIDSTVISAFLGSFDGLRGLSLAGVNSGSDT
ncbi:hypothetical protein PRZ48_015059 [Zasmidium cellare]|uniref:Uncharacterized protein n=1 Tax=Zasmidium cellare TaxID=395010 RepID=A0ABR0DXQ2_ZASCE|nr:hypothetical protein PRZ48_015059 [Zasmidium cellare]